MKRSRVFWPTVLLATAAFAVAVQALIDEVSTIGWVALGVLALPTVTAWVTELMARRRS